ncbi:aminotransferase class V-fold PLP-dependent enzyme [Fulvivirga maritima]|uniref:aminotransferase class V-fold PLP-dependent enzyme n=1 Tax=Fulvivirga maritima TaxID=2904247 RepID=UPI001F38488D|nr:aminotransferase class V-fold PLP-dependent enzyme [Fulvivirga maritima]UII28404.1 aminotransferase class V-fold PLP-dependent enzyme [Fulvivirga maritima]
MKIIKRPTSSHDSWNENILQAIDSQTKAVALPHAYWADGYLFDLKKIREKTREVGALLTIDGTQSVGALPFRIQEIQPDALICAGYKWLFGPYSIGLAYFGSYFDNGEPIEENWINRENSEDFAGLVNYKSGYQPQAIRYDVGEHSNFILVPMMLQALKLLNQWKPENIQSHCANIIEKPLAKLEGSHFYVDQASERSAHLFGIKSKVPLDTNLLMQKLKSAQISVSLRGSSIRVSPHIYNTAEDIEKLVDILLQLK